MQTACKSNAGQPWIFNLCCNKQAVLGKITSGVVVATIIKSISLSDYVYIYNDENKSCEKYINKHKTIKEALKNTKCEFIDYSDSLDSSDSSKY